MKTVLTVLMLAALCVASGCGRNPDVVPVSGLITLDGKPLAGAHVSFQPIQDDLGAAAIGSYGTTSADGRYTLRLVEPDIAGAVPGLHRVRIRTAVAEEVREDSPVAVEKLPPRYHDGTLTFEVPVSGTEAADFELSSQ